MGMFFKQLLDPARGCASYMVSCLATGECAVVDPLHELGAEEYVLEAAERGLKITHVIETHAHADHVSAARDLARLTGARIYQHPAAEPAYDFVPVDDGTVLEVGNVRLRVLHTPGHTPESISLAASDTTRTEDPWFILTGDALFVGDVGRPDLVGALYGATAEDYARELYDTLWQKLLVHPDHVEIFPAHYGGSVCGGQNMSGKASSTIGFEKRFNRSLQQPDRESFVRFVLNTLKPAPEAAVQTRGRNLGRDLLAGITGGNG